MSDPNGSLTTIEHRYYLLKHIIEGRGERLRRTMQLFYALWISLLPLHFSHASPLSLAQREKLASILEEKPLHTNALMAGAAATPCLKVTAEPESPSDTRMYGWKIAIMPKEYNMPPQTSRTCLSITDYVAERCCSM